jgi:hypothetical protein
VINIPSCMPGFPKPWTFPGGKVHYLTGFVGEPCRYRRPHQTLCWRWLDKECAVDAKSVCKRCERAMSEAAKKARVAK